MNTKETAAWLAMLRYTLYAVATTFATWLQQLGTEKWDKLASYDVWTIGASLTLSALAAIGAVMNGRWAEAKEVNETNS
jgi:hypothetical protein